MTFLGFIFAQGATPEAMAASLREAHARISFTWGPLLDLW